MAKTFRDIGEGAVFKFAPSSDGFFNDPKIYTKITNRKYVINDDSIPQTEYTVGSIYAEIIVIREADNG